MEQDGLLNSFEHFFSSHFQYCENCKTFLNIDCFSGGRELYQAASGDTATDKDSHIECVLAIPKGNLTFRK